MRFTQTRVRIHIGWSFDRAHWQATEDTDRNRKIAMINMIKLMMITTVMITLIWVFVNAKWREEKRRVQMRQSTNFALPETSRMVLYRCEPSKIRIRFVETVKFTFIDWLIRFILLELICWADRRWRWEMFTDNDAERVEPMNKANPLGGGRSMEWINAIDPVSNGRIRNEPIFILIVEENHFDKDSLVSSFLEMSRKTEFECHCWIRSIKRILIWTSPFNLFAMILQRQNWHYHCSVLFICQLILVFFSHRDKGEYEERKDHLFFEVLQAPLCTACNTSEIYQIQLLLAWSKLSRLLLDLVMRVFMSMFVAKDFSLKYLPCKKTAKKTDDIDQWMEVMNNSLCCLFRLFRG